MNKIIGVILVISCILATLVSCGSTSYVPPNVQNNFYGDQSGTESGGNTSTPQQPEKTPTAYDELNENEKFIFDALMINFDQFYAPSTVRITKILTGFGEHWDNCGDTIPKTTENSFYKGLGICITLRISCETKNGNNSNSVYSLVLVEGTNDSYNCKRGALYESNTSEYLSEPEFKYASPAKLNKAIIEYCEEMGLN